MKISKKILGLTLCSLISVGSCQLTLLKANAQGVTTSNSSKVKWKEEIKLELRDKNNPSCKGYCTLNLYDEDGYIKLEEKGKIQDNFRFGDTYVFGVCNDHGNGEPKVCFKVDFDSVKPAEQQLKEEINKFNKYKPKVGDTAYMHGLYADNTFIFSDNNDVLKKLCKNSYTSRYSSKWDRGYRFQNEGLQEMIFRHTRTGVDLASKEYWS